jgi:hypothetical protein
MSKEGSQLLDEEAGEPLEGDLSGSKDMRAQRGAWSEAEQKRHDDSIQT